MPHIFFFNLKGFLLMIIISTDMCKFQIFQVYRQLNLFVFNLQVVFKSIYHVVVLFFFISHSEEFEEVNLETTNRVSGFEELTLPAGTETYNTKLCGCICHENKRDERFRRRTRHCFSCSLKVMFLLNLKHIYNVNDKDKCLTP